MSYDLIENSYLSIVEIIIFAGIVSIGSIAVSTALGGYLLTKFNPSPRKALLFLIATWTIIIITYLIGAIVGCDEPQVKQLLISTINELVTFHCISILSQLEAQCSLEHSLLYICIIIFYYLSNILFKILFREKFSDNLECSFECQCNEVDLFNPVNYHTMNYFSPCHAGCREYNSHLQKVCLDFCEDFYRICISLLQIYN